MELKYIFNYNFEGFVASLKSNFLGSIYDAFLRYVCPYILKSIYRCDYLPSWLSFFRSLIRNNKFLLVILDGTRYDAFSTLYTKYMRGKLYAVRVPPPNTYGWLPRAFSSPEFDNVRIFCARLAIKSHDIMIDKLIPKYKKMELINIRPKKIRMLGSVLPSEVNEEIFRIGLSGRDIIWYSQPHFPWIYDPDLSKMLMKEVLLHDFVPPDIVAAKLKKLSISKKRPINAYYGNLVLALKYVSELLNYVKDSGMKYNEVVITSDHGELLGEYNLYLHQDYELPQLVIVPWLKVEV